MKLFNVSFAVICVDSKVAFYTASTVKIDTYNGVLYIYKGKDVVPHTIYSSNHWCEITDIEELSK